MGRDALTAGRVSSILLSDWGPMDKPLAVLVGGVMLPVERVTVINGKYVIIPGAEK